MCPSLFSSSYVLLCAFHSVFVSFCPFLLTSVHYCPFIFVSVCFCPYLFVSVCFCPFLSVSVRLCLFLCGSISLYLFLSLFVCFCPFLSVFVRLCLCMSVFVCFCQFLSISVHFCPYFCPKLASMLLYLLEIDWIIPKCCWICPKLYCFDFFVNYIGPAQQGLLILSCLLCNTVLPMLCFPSLQEISSRYISTKEIHLFYNLNRPKVSPVQALHCNSMKQLLKHVT